MGHYSYIHAHFPVSEFSEQEQSFLAELRQQLPYDDEWIRLPYQEQQNRRIAAHNRLQLPGEPDDWQFVRQWQLDDKWYVHHHVKPSVSPPFPVVTSEFDSLAERHLPEVWLVAFTAPGRWQSEYWSIYQTLSETRRHVRPLFGKLWRLFYISEYFHEYSDQYDLREIRRKAPPGSVAHKRLRSVFTLFKLRDYLSLHQWVLSRDLPSGTILQLDIMDYLYSGSEEEAKLKLRSDQQLSALDAVDQMDLVSLIDNKLLAELGDADEYVSPWLSAADAWCEASMYLMEQGEDEDEWLAWHNRSNPD